MEIMSDKTGTKRVHFIGQKGWLSRVSVVAGCFLSIVIETLPYSTCIATQKFNFHFCVLLKCW